jgi:hypothetical protein
LQQTEIERLRKRLRDHGIDDREAPEPSPPLQSCTDLSEALAVLDQFDTVVQRPTEEAYEPGTDLWTEQRRAINAKVDQLVSGKYPRDVGDLASSTPRQRPP